MPATVQIDPLRESDAARCAELERLLFPGDDPWSERAFTDELGATVFLEVRTDNEAAQALYEAEGFTVVGLRKRYYRPSGADAYTMRRESKS